MKCERSTQYICDKLRVTKSFCLPLISRDIQDRIILFRRDLFFLNRIISRVLKLVTMKVAVHKKDCSSKRIHSCSIATIHPAPKDFHLHSLHPDVFRNVFRNYYLMEVTPEKNFRCFDISKNPSSYEFPKSMNAQYYYRLKVWPGKLRFPRYHYQLCNELIVRRLMFDDFRCLFVNNAIPSGNEEKNYAHNRCVGILVKSHFPHRTHSQSCYQCLCRHVVGHVSPHVVTDDNANDTGN